MREIRPSGSEGGVGSNMPIPTPIKPGGLRMAQHGVGRNTAAQSSYPIPAVTDALLATLHFT